jgi:hypothetical protein
MLSGDLHSRMGADREGDASEPRRLPEAGEAREVEADHTTLPSPLAAEPRVAPQPPPLGSRSARPRPRGHPAPRAPPRLPPMLQSHASDGHPASGARSAAECSGARPNHRRSARAPATRVGSLGDGSRIYSLRRRRKQPTPPGRAASPNRVSLPHRHGQAVREGKQVETRASGPPQRLRARPADAQKGAAAATLDTPRRTRVSRRLWAF